VVVQVSQNAFIAVLMFLITVLMHNRSRFESHKTVRNVILKYELLLLKFLGVCC
jgi:hypothetical protein